MADFEETQDFKGEPTPQDDAAPAEHPKKIGRYRIETVLGKGGFGRVYLAHDEQLERLVAIKVPHASLITNPEDAELYLTEARTVANLDHPSIVPVHDVGRTEECPCFIVSKYIEGTDLAKKIKEHRLKYRDAAELVVTIAEALHYAHKQGLVHRDVKPGNILIDSEDKPFVVDFGLALREEDYGKGPEYAGTPAYMSPEQARGEGHRVDGRSDIFSLGVVLYELLVGRKPFRGDTQPEILDQIVRYEPRPPRQHDDRIPKELERICHKAMAKRATDRYSTAKDFAEDLRLFLSEQIVVQGDESPGGVTPVTVETIDSQGGSTTADSESSTSVGTGSSNAQPIKIVPKGLRSFDAHDADFFLELLPGPRDRYGLPDSLRFWKTRIEETDPDNTFSVGLIYGPSGCGKSSLVKAGLLPRLSEDVIPVYVEATPGETETRLLHGLRKRCPALDDNLSLKDTLAALRRGQGIPVGSKVLIVLDQFEQWLHAHKEEENTDLVQALRQCDGGRVQCIVMVRDDFWMAATRFMRELEVQLLEGQNSASVDLFSTRHAEKVLSAFGRAFGTLPDNISETTREQKDFLNQSVTGLSEEGKVICVLLALFAEMMKGKTWTPATLKKVGGTTGVGITFLEETFSASTSPPEHRYHQKAARAVLRDLLPDSGTDIKGYMRSHAELMESSGYGSRSKDFDDLVRILDNEIRLITPTDPEGKDAEDDSVSQSEVGQKYFQLTHDYLVHSLRDWLTRKQKETRRGRAELKLFDTSVTWNAKPENRFLPSWWEHLTIRLLTDKRKWTEPQRKMMGKAGRVHGLRSGIALALLIVASVTGVTIRNSILKDRAIVQARNTEQQNLTRADGLIESLLKADIAQVPSIIADMEMYRNWVNPKLTVALDNSDEGSKEHLHASLALLSADTTQIDYLKNRLLHAEPEQVATIVSLLENHKDVIVADLWRVANYSNKGEDRQLLQAASALAVYDTDNEEKWDGIADRVVDALVAENSLRVAVWIRTLHPARHHLVKPLSVVYRIKGEDRSQTQIDLATEVLEQYAADDLTSLADLLFDAEPKQFVTLFDEFAKHGDDALSILNEELDRTLTFHWNDPPLDPSWSEPTAEITGKITEAQGMIAERFAFCQTMPLEEFKQLAEELRKFGYRPVRLRPYAHDESVHVAAAWIRDDRDWRMASGQTAVAIQQQDEQQRAAGLAAVDIAGYVGESDGKPEELYSALWLKKRNESEDARIYAGVSSAEHKTTNGVLVKEGYEFRQSLQGFRGLAGQQKYSGIRKKMDINGTSSWNQSSATFDAKEYFNKIHWDIDLNNAPDVQSTSERNEKSLADAETKLKEKPDDLNAHYSRGKAHFCLGNDKQAVADFNFVIEKRASFSFGYLYRAILHARMNHAEEANQDLTKFTELSTSASTKVYLDTVVAAYLGEDAAAMKRLEAFIETKMDDNDSLYNAACAYSICSGIFKEDDATKSKLYADRAINLITQAVSKGFSNYSEMQADADLDPIRETNEFTEIMKVGNLALRYTSVWNTSTTYESLESHGLSPTEHLVECQEMQGKGYRLTSISSASVNGELVTASVWHRPLNPDEKKETLAHRQANAAVAALRMGEAENVWPLLKHSPDPRVRSYIIHWLRPRGGDAKTIIARYEQERDVTIKRALLLCLGEFELSDSDKQPLIETLLTVYRSDLDAGLHAASEWLLRQWKQGEQLAVIDKELQQTEEELVAAKEKQRQWYVNSQGQTFVILDAGEFQMGSPETEAGRGANEELHRRKIGRRIAISTKEVTREQWRAFYNATKVWRANQDQFKPYVRSDDSPMVGMNWYEAAYYCNWLSEQEGIPEDQWCYEKNEEDKYGPGMKAKDNFLELTGYRLPTEAEWEYACRAGASGSRYYGITEALLHRYAWYQANGDNHTHPVARLKPSDFGLFDMQGNVSEWCYDAYSSYPMPKEEEAVGDAPPVESVEVVGRRLLRGGSFNYQSSLVRSAFRKAYLPVSRNFDFGFRPARTYHLFP